MNQSQEHSIECNKCKKKFPSIFALKPSGLNCLCWACLLQQHAAQGSFRPDVSQQYKTLSNGKEDQMDAQVSGTCNAQETKNNNISFDPDKLYGVLNKIRHLRSSAGPSSSREFSNQSKASHNSHNEKLGVKKVFFRKGMHLSRRGSTNFVCPDCSRSSGSSGSQNVDLVSQMTMLRIKPIDDEDKGFKYDTVDDVQQEVSERGESSQRENFFMRRPKVLGPVMDEGQDLPTRHIGQCGHVVESSFMARCHVCKRRYNISSKVHDLFGCLICYFRPDGGRRG